ncbi:type 2 isopentenyl-diphosphate Delta-isomerase [Gracilimonas tropica]|uniref:type 2 isopentenyl-diphosphate Delta-isomerase n=1 Tax=Gracilimonas tropica TaxID=454600 RepID=UPI0003A2FD66|nr:type 2 isopentenyl-diphosphate Delta-isomerase [Gracilimonas tropica]
MDIKAWNLDVCFMTDIRNRKKDHVELTVTEGTQYQHQAGFEEYKFIHNALPEVNFDEVSTKAELLGHTFDFPLFISSMTGGYAEAGPVNAIIAEFCQQHNIPFGVGSQRAMLEKPELTDTFSIVRKKAPDAFICANIGGAQLIGGLPKERLKRLTDSIDANAVIVHLNPLQELMQPEGDRNFKGILEGIEKLVQDSKIPVIVKETGAGITEHTARRLLNAGVDVIDVAGSGGTSWAKVENFRTSNTKANHQFNEWGTPTVDCILELSTLEWERSFEIIASGGIRSAFDIAKSLCLGAHFTATAQPIIRAVVNEGLDGLTTLFTEWQKDLKTIMTLLGCTHISLLNKTHLKKAGQSRDRR